MSHVLVIGGSRGIGLQTVKRALARRHRVRVLARSADRIAIKDSALETRPGSALNAEDVRSALEDVDAVVQALGISAGPRMVFGPVTLFSDATRVLVPAMQAAGVARLISVTGFGAGNSRSHIGCVQRIPFELALGRAYADKNVQEQLIKDSALDWVIARPGILFDGPRTGRTKILVEPEDWRNGFISRADVAEFLVDQVESESYLRTAPVLVY